jgi:hypothetical protein
MNALHMMERRSRTLFICHAIRHLLDHIPAETTNGDVQAIDILQSAIDAAEAKYYDSYEAAGNATNVINPPDPLERITLNEGTGQPKRIAADADSAKADVEGEIAIGRAALKRSLGDNPMPLLAMLEALVHALKEKELQNAAQPENCPGFVGPAA